MDTIFALATAAGRAGVSVFRVSGPQAIDSANFFGVEDLPYTKPVLRKLRTEQNGLIDQALVLRFPEGRSFTGEETIEFHCHGSPAIANCVMSGLSTVPSLRLAEPGEFTRRALMNGKLDLAQVEGLADLLEAETEVQRQRAIQVFDGALGDRVELWRHKVIEAMALIEVTIDFADEDVPVDVVPDVQALLSEVKASIASELQMSSTSERIRNGFEVAILGAPNVGKSTLLNRLAGRDAALTSSYAGTTRDIIEVRYDLKGIPVIFLDTAGIRKTEDHVESLGISRALKRAEQADLRIVLKLGEEEESPIRLSDDDIVALAKRDSFEAGVFGVSGMTGQGITQLLDLIFDRLNARVPKDSVTSRERHRVSMSHALSILEEVEALIVSGSFQAELVAEDLRRIVGELEIMIGRVDVENVLDEVFSAFCLGK